MIPAQRYYVLVSIVLGICGLILAGPASAHHSVQAQFDVHKTFTITGAGTTPVCDGGDTVSLSPGQLTAVCQLSSGLTKVGSPYTVSAAYDGDGNYLTSTSPTRSVRAK